ncbi:hypothetical protein KAI56_00640 [Candidatus Parcubacteria bacterium]|nr:hypothetical protein [Candidatus Parcubacteria bacterium]
MTVGFLIGIALGLLIASVESYFRYKRRFKKMKEEAKENILSSSTGEVALTEDIDIEKEFNDNFPGK